MSDAQIEIMEDDEVWYPVTNKEVTTAMESDQHGFLFSGLFYRTLRLMLFAGFGMLLCIMPAAGQSFVVTERQQSFVVTDRVTSPPVVSIVKTKTRTRYLVSEKWCVHCPAAGERFVRLGWPAKNIITNAECFRRFGFCVPHVPYEFEEPESSHPQPMSGASSCNCSAACVCGCQSGGVCKCGQTAAQPARQVSQQAAGRYVQWAGKTYDMETWRRHCSMRNCPMCNFLDNAAAAYRRSQSYVEPPPSPQSSTPDDVISEAIAIANLTAADVVAELGSGSGLPAIRMVEASGCRVVGVEIDPEQVRRARQNIAAAGLSDRITIVQGDVRDFDPAAYGATVIYAYLESDLLAEIKPQLACGRITVCPGHHVDGMGFQLVGQCWVRKS